MTDLDRPTGPSVDPALLRGLTQRRLSRRDAFRFTGAGITAAGLASFLAACGTEGSKREATDVEKFWAGKTKTGRLDFANWPYYIDKPNAPKHPTLEKFTKETGIKVNYRDVIQENPTFYGRIQPELAAGNDIGFDLIVMTNGIYVDKLLAQNFVAPLDHKYLPNFNEHAGPAVKDPAYDPGNKYTIPWQSGITGIAWNPKYVKRDLTSIEDMFDPAFDGKVGMFADNLDLPNFGLLATGVSPEDSTPADWEKAAEKLRSQKTVRRYYEQGYIDELARGDIWVSMAWSGDVFIANDEDPDLNLQFVVPDEGGLIWTDNMMIPVTAKHPVDAITLMDYVYQPEVAATLAEWIWYITPVPASRDVLLERAAESSGEDRAYYRNIAKSPLIYPTEEMTRNLHNYRVLTREEEKEWNRLFEPVYQG